jgi:hypothetical protein
MPVAAAYDPSAWGDFAVAEVGASAALAGLLVVACSINLVRIIQLPSVVARMGATLVLFTGVLVTGTILLVPGQGHVAVGVELVGAGLVTVVVAARAHDLRNLGQEYRRRSLVAAGLEVAAGALIAVAGVLEAAEVWGGLYWLLPAVVLAFCVGLVNAWVALVEILR